VMKNLDRNLISRKLFYDHKTLNIWFIPVFVKVILLSHSLPCLLILSLHVSSSTLLFLSYFLSPKHPISLSQNLSLPFSLALPFFPHYLSNQKCKMKNIDANMNSRNWFCNYNKVWTKNF